jgi:hypothetical protein
LGFTPKLDSPLCGDSLLEPLMNFDEAQTFFPAIPHQELTLIKPKL